MLKVPSITFSLQDGVLHASIVHGIPPEHTGRPFEQEFATLESLNERGLEDAATLIGKYVIGAMSIWNPTLINGQYPNLYINTKLPAHQLPPNSLPPMPPRRGSRKPNVDE
jgi:hypothetical protein